VCLCDSAALSGCVCGMCGRSTITVSCWLENTSQSEVRVCMGWGAGRGRGRETGLASGKRAGEQKEGGMPW
jgi:hypothetical protein